MSSLFHNTCINKVLSYIYKTLFSLHCSHHFILVKTALTSRKVSIFFPFPFCFNKGYCILTTECHCCRPSLSNILVVSHVFTDRCPQQDSCLTLYALLYSASELPSTRACIKPLMEPTLGKSSYKPSKKASKVV